MEVGDPDRPHLCWSDKQPEKNVWCKKLNGSKKITKSVYFSPAHLTLGDHVAVWWRRFFATNLTIMIIKVMTVLVMRMIMITLLAAMMIVVAGVRRWKLGRQFCAYCAPSPCQVPRLTFSRGTWSAPTSKMINPYQAFVKHRALPEPRQPLRPDVILFLFQLHHDHHLSTLKSLSYHDHFHIIMIINNHHQPTCCSPSAWLCLCLATCRHINGQWSRWRRHRRQRRQRRKQRQRWWRLFWK